MESSDKTFHGTIPHEILDEFFYLVAEEENLKELSLVCPRWRHLSQRKLFTTVQIDPVAVQGVCQVATSPHAHLATYIKEVCVVNLSGTKTLRFPPHFIYFLESLRALQTLNFRCLHLDWAHIPGDIVNALLGVISGPMFQTLEVAGGKNFPVRLFLGGVNIDTLILMDAQKFSLSPPTRPIDSKKTQLTKLKLLDSHTIRAFLTLFYTTTTISQAFCQNLTQLTLKYVECGLFSYFRSEIIGELLSTVGTSVESLKVEVSWPFTEPNQSLNLHSLMSLRHLRLNLTAPIPLPREQELFFTIYVLPIITSLPKPQNLATCSITLNYLTQSIPIITDCIQPFKALGSQIEPVFMDVRWSKLSSVRVCLQLLGANSHTPAQTRPQNHLFPLLQTKISHVEALIRA